MNYRIVEKIGNDTYYVQYEKEIFGKKIWFNILEKQYIFGDGIDSSYWLSNPFFWIITLLAIFIVVGIIFILMFEMFNTKRFSSISNAKYFVNVEKDRLLRKAEKKDLIDKKGSSKIVGIFDGDDFIDGERLEKIKRK